ncbi:MAG: class I SAM-dependent methyltransferase, partial [Chloroflexota bacterium]
MWLYDLEAHKYDRIKEYSLDEERILVVEPILGELNHQKSPIILDVGVGTGRVPQFLLADGRFIFEEHGHVVGLEPSPKMRQYAIDNVAQYPPHVSFIRQYAYPLPFKSASFDGVTSLETIEFFPKPHEAIEEMVRVLKPGGFLMITRR